MANATAIVIIRDFIDACVRADVDEFMSYFTEDAVWWNAPWKEISGRTAIGQALQKGKEQMKALPWEVRHIVADGNIVMTERVDNFEVQGKRVSVPCMGIFELRDGKIAAWRDYWDLKSFEAQM
ncbi:MAG: limonene-1,2-epoxide hydrolase family protein [Candidatus Korobacteraceae bacterium]